MGAGAQDSPDLFEVAAPVKATPTPMGDLTIAAPSTALTFSVVIAAYTEERWDLLTDAVRSVVEQALAPLEVIVVVDHNDRLFGRLCEFLPLLLPERSGSPPVKVIPNHSTKGLGGARNSGVDCSTGSIIVFLDDDAIADAQWTAALRGAYERQEDLLGVGGQIDASVEGGRPQWFPREFDWVLGCTYRGMPPPGSDVRNLIGCNMSFRREAFGEGRRFLLGYGCDETEFCIRLRREVPNARLIFEPSARVTHHVPRDRMAWRYLIRRCYFEGGSKAVVSWLAGRGVGLKSERAYTLRTLPSGVLIGLVEAVRRRQAAPLARSAAIIVGFGATLAGYLTGSVTTKRQAHRRGWRPPAMRMDGYLEGQPQPSGSPKL